MKNYFTIPDSKLNFELNMKLINLKESHPEFFYDDIEIESTFGCPSPCIWNGNRINKELYSTLDIQVMLVTYMSKNIKYRFTFTNDLIEDIHLQDTFGNVIAKLGELPGNGVIVNSDIMKTYIKTRYPLYSITNSIVGFFKDKNKIDFDLINEMSKDETVVLPLSLNNKFDELKKLQHPEHIEVLCNQPCIENCPCSYDHYVSYNKHNLYYINLNPQDVECRFKNTNHSYKENKTYINHSILCKYNDLGINHFKIAGRDIPDLAIEGYIDNFIKDEYKELIGNYLLNINKKYDVTWDLATESYLKNT